MHPYFRKYPITNKKQSWSSIQFSFVWHSFIVYINTKFTIAYITFYQVKLKHRQNTDALHSINSISLYMSYTFTDKMFYANIWAFTYGMYTCVRVHCVHVCEYIGIKLKLKITFFCMCTRVSQFLVLVFSIILNNFICFFVFQMYLRS